MRGTMEDLPAYDQLYEIFNPYALNRQREMRTKGTRFVHYTSAEVAVNIIKKKEVWMRKSTAMNDFMEIDHGIKCLSALIIANLVNSSGASWIDFTQIFGSTQGTVRSFGAKFSVSHLFNMHV
jgi:hypothetical protein